MLYYHRCDDCLTTFTSLEKKVDFCDCNGTVTLMGQVQGNKYVRHEDRSPCDGRCTHASGPMCDCICNGANHGSGKVVQVVVKEGIVKVEGLTEQDVERAHTFRKLRDYAEGLFTTKWQASIDKRNRGEWMDRKEYVDMSRDRYNLDKIINMKVYDRRTKELIAFIAANKR